MIDLSQLKTLDKVFILAMALAGGVALGMYLERSRLYAKFKAAAEANKQPAAQPAAEPTGAA